MRSLTKIKRNRYGDLTLPFFGFILVGVLTIASLTSIAQYNIMVEKLNAGLEEANNASVKYILDNLSDSALIGTLSPAVLAELANARNHGVAVAQSSLTTKIKDLIAVRNGDGVNVFDITDSSITKDADDNVIIQFAVEAQVLPPPTPKYKRVYKKVVAKPFSLNSREVCTELSCPPGDCGDCGACDECTGTCIPDFSVPDGQGGFKNPDTATATDDNIACGATDPFVEFCEHLGWNVIEEAGLTGCELNNCKIVPTRHEWTEQFSYYNTVAIDGAAPLSFGFPSSNINDYCLEGVNYVQDEEFTVLEDTGKNKKFYAVCQTNHSFPGFLSKRIFASSTKVNGAFGGIAGADAICQARANAAGLPGAYRALLSDSVTDAKDRIPGNVSYRLVDGTVFNSCPLWDDLGAPNRVDTNIRLNESGVEVPDGVSLGRSVYTGFALWQLGTRPFVWTGTGPAGTKEYLSPFYSSPLGISNCYDWTVGTYYTYDQSGGYGNAKYFNWVSYGELFTGEPGCNGTKHLYCVEI